MKTCLSNVGIGTRLRRFTTTIVAALLVMTTGFVAAQSDGVALNPAHPDTYTVVKGDTLWDISSMFLKDPWYWPEIWYVNPQVENPHLIYPGDILKLVYIDGQPRIQLERGNGRVVRGDDGRLSPRIREEALDQAITTVAFKDIKPFLSGGMIMDRGEAKELPYVAALRDHLVAGAGHNAFVKGMDEDAQIGSEFLILRIDDRLRDPDNGNDLGYEIIYIGIGELRAKGDADDDEPNTVFLTKTNREVRRGDRVKPMDLKLPLNFYPQAPSEEIDGEIISVVDGVSRIGQYQMIILNRGTEDGLEAGSVLSVWQAGGSKRYSGNHSLFGEKVNMPDVEGGHVMIVKAYEDISYALVMEAQLEMQVGDRVKNP